MELTNFKPTYYDNNYLINKEGIIYSLKRNKLMSPTKNTGGYLHFRLGKKMITVHRIVLMTFKYNIKHHKLEINHKNKIKTDNRLDNLEWCTSRYNQNHRMQNNKYGVYYEQTTKKYKAQIRDKNQKNINLGRFAVKNDAYIAFYNEYVKIHGIPPWKDKN